MVIPTIHFHSEFSNIPLRIAKGHFASSRGHLNYYVDMTYTKHRLEEARQAARELSIQIPVTTVVDTILCLDGTEVLGTCLAEEIVKAGVHNTNEHDSLYVVTPEQTSGGQFLFRENTAHLIRGRHVIILAASVISGAAVQTALQAVRYYGGMPAAICCVFTCPESIEGMPVASVFRSEQLEDFQYTPANQCPLCKAGVALDALINSYGISSFYR